MTNTSFRILNGSSDKHWLNKKNGYDKKNTITYHTLVTLFYHILS